jgi:hypothetical protein
MVSRRETEGAEWGVAAVVDEHVETLRATSLLAAETGKQ